MHSAGADLDADRGSPKNVRRAARWRRWVTVVLQVTNVTAGGQPAGHGGHRLRPPEAGRSTA